MSALACSRQLRTGLATTSRLPMSRSGVSRCFVVKPCIETILLESMIVMDEDKNYRKRIILIVAGILVAIPIFFGLLFLVLGYFIPL